MPRSRGVGSFPTELTPGVCNVSFSHPQSEYLLNRERLDRIW